MACLFYFRRECWWHWKLINEAPFPRPNSNLHFINETNSLEKWVPSVKRQVLCSAALLGDDVIVSFWNSQNEEPWCIFFSNQTNCSNALLISLRKKNNKEGEKIKASAPDIQVIISSQTPRFYFFFPWSFQEAFDYCFFLKCNIMFIFLCVHLCFVMGVRSPRSGVRDNCELFCGC